MINQKINRFWSLVSQVTTLTSDFTENEHGISDFQSTKSFQPIEENNLSQDTVQINAAF